MKPKKFSNQSSEQILKHLENFLDFSVSYDLNIDPLGIAFYIKESIKTRRSKRRSIKRTKLKEEQKNMSKRERRMSATRKRTSPKIRTVKKGRTVSLKGRTY